MRQNYATRLRPRVLQKHCIESAPRPFSYVVPALPIPTSYHFDGTFHPRHVITQQRRPSWWGTREARRCSPACVLTHTLQSPVLPASLRWRSSVSTVLGVQILQQRASIGKDFGFERYCRKNAAIDAEETPLRNMEADPLPQRCSNGIRQCHVYPLRQ